MNIIRYFTIDIIIYYYFKSPQNPTAVDLLCIVIRNVIKQEYTLV